MTGARTMMAAVLMALLSLAGIVGMLVAEAGAWDVVFFFLALLPFMVAAACWWLWRSQGGR